MERVLELSSTNEEIKHFSIKYSTYKYKLSTWVLVEFMEFGSQVHQFTVQIPEFEVIQRGQLVLTPVQTHPWVLMGTYCKIQWESTLSIRWMTWQVQSEDYWTSYLEQRSIVNLLVCTFWYRVLFYNWYLYFLNSNYWVAQRLKWAKLMLFTRIHYLLKYFISYIF